MMLFASGCSSTSVSAEPAATLPATTDSGIVAEGRVEPIRYADIAFNANGIVSEVLVSEGEQVKAGDVIARLENSEGRQAEVAMAEEAFLQAQQTFASAEAAALGKLADAHESVRKAQYEFDNFDIPSDLRDMGTREALSDTAANLEEARVAFEPYRSLEERLAAELRRENPSNPDVYRSTAKNYKKRLDEAWSDYNKAIKWATLEFSLENAQAELTQAQKEYDILSSGSDAGEKAMAVAQYDAARANLAAAQAALADVELRAPFDETVAGLEVKHGETVTSGQVIVSIADFSYWMAKTTDLTEIDVVNIKEGRPVTIKLDAIPDVTLRGNVFSIAQNYAEKQGDIVYEVTILLTDQNPALRWGMTTEVRFEQ